MWIGPHRKTIIRNKECVEKVVPSIPRIHAARILCSLLSHKKLLIGTMEWEFDGDAVEKFKSESETAIRNMTDKIHSLVDFLQKFSRKSHVFRANQLVTTINMIYEMEELLRNMYVPSDLKKIERISVLLSGESLTPILSMDTYLPLRIGGIARCSENISHEYDEKSPDFLEKFVYMSALTAGFGVLRFAKFDDIARRIWDRLRMPVTIISDELHMKVELAGSFKGDMTLFHMRSPCGYWIYMNNSCGLGWLCKRCADPFEFKYYQNLGRRCVLEPEWNDMVAWGQTVRMKNNVEEAKKRYREDERKKKSSGDMTVIQKMWGIGREVAEDSGDQGVEDISQKMAEDGVVVVKDSEDSEDVTAPESHESMKQSQSLINKKSNEGKQDSEDSEDLATHNSDEFTKQCKFQKLAICITMNDMDFFVPRVRVSVKDSGILIMIHTGIDKFLRIEIAGGPDGKTVIRKFQNSYNRKDGIQKVLPSTPRYHAAQILCGLLSHEKSLIDTMEWEIEGGINVKHHEEETESVKASLVKEVHFLSVLQKYSGKSRGIFRANKLATSWNMTPEMENFLQKILVPADLKSIERINVTPSEKSMTPLFCFDTYLPLSDRGVPCGTKTIGHEYIKEIYEAFGYMSILSPGFGHFRFATYDDYAKNIWDNVKYPIKNINQKLYMKEEPANSFMGELTLLHMRSRCGYWIYAVLDSKLDIFNEYRVYNKICGLGWLCKRCTDPFEYDYYQNLGRRVLCEPEYNEVISCGFEENRHEWSPMIEGARIKYEKNEEKKEKKGIQKMWGFWNGVSDSEDKNKDEHWPINDSGETTHSSTDSEDSEKMSDSENDGSEVSEDAKTDVVIIQEPVIEKKVPEDSDFEAEENDSKKDSGDSTHSSIDSEDQESSEDSENEESEVKESVPKDSEDAIKDSGSVKKDSEAGVDSEDAKMEDEAFENDVVIQKTGQRELLMEKKVPEDSDSDSEVDKNDAKKDSEASEDMEPDGFTKFMMMGRALSEERMKVSISILIVMIVYVNAFDLLRRYERNATESPLNAMISRHMRIAQIFNALYINMGLTDHSINYKDVVAGIKAKYKVVEELKEELGREVIKDNSTDNIPKFITGKKKVYMETFAHLKVDPAITVVDILNKMKDSDGLDDEDKRNATSYIDACYKVAFNLLGYSRKVLTDLNNAETLHTGIQLVVNLRDHSDGLKELYSMFSKVESGMQQLEKIEITSVKQNLSLILEVLQELYQPSTNVSIATAFNSSEVSVSNLKILVSCLNVIRVDDAKIHDEIEGLLRNWINFKTGLQNIEKTMADYKDLNKLAEELYNKRGVVERLIDESFDDFKTKTGSEYIGYFQKLSTDLFAPLKQDQNFTDAVTLFSNFDKMLTEIGAIQNWVFDTLQKNKIQKAECKPLEFDVNSLDNINEIPTAVSSMKSEKPIEKLLPLLEAISTVKTGLESLKTTRLSYDAPTNPMTTKPPTNPKKPTQQRRKRASGALNIKNKQSLSEVAFGIRSLERMNQITQLESDLNTVITKGDTVVAAIRNEKDPKKKGEMEKVWNKFPEVRSALTSLQTKIKGVMAMSTAAEKSLTEVSTKYKPLGSVDFKENIDLRPLRLSLKLLNPPNKEIEQALENLDDALSMDWALAHASFVKIPNLLVGLEKEFKAFFEESKKEHKNRQFDEAKDKSFMEKIEENMMWVIIGGVAFLCLLISSIGGMAYGIWWFINVYDPEMKKKLEPDENYKHDDETNIYSYMQMQDARLDLNKRDATGQPPLWQMILDRDYEGMKKYVLAGGIIDQDLNGTFHRTCLHELVHLQQKEMCYFFLKHAADQNLHDYEGEDPDLFADRFGMYAKFEAYFHRREQNPDSFFRDLPALPRPWNVLVFDKKALKRKLRKRLPLRIKKNITWGYEPGMKLNDFTHIVLPQEMVKDRDTLILDDDDMIRWQLMACWGSLICHEWLEELTTHPEKHEWLMKKDWKYYVVNTFYNGNKHEKKIFDCKTLIHRYRPALLCDISIMILKTDDAKLTAQQKKWEKIIEMFGEKLIKLKNPFSIVYSPKTINPYYMMDYDYWYNRNEKICHSTWILKCEDSKTKQQWIDDCSELMLVDYHYLFECLARHYLLPFDNLVVEIAMNEKFAKEEAEEKAKAEGAENSTTSTTNSTQSTVSQVQSKMGSASKSRMTVADLPDTAKPKKTTKKKRPSKSVMK
ncbi:hypothetical protein GCK72_021726 [Caenorhabditis remanei]|uniref:Uncharacterized protein n=1 Tax=Caenorhabditis remanei TaxID=31234 RepID=A0A6A5GIW8_CAERE|nr:hypothetical protein GCK72_021726 [Caenorhabditis remanei]KAF1755157.1 hypothetical protein GCK72_021726 [Caenorhabditis remanei]